MPLTLGFFLRTRAHGLLGLALAAACSDDGFTNQSSGQAETSTTGSPTGATALDDESPPATTADPADGTGAQPETTGSEGDTANTSIGPETVTGTTSGSTGSDTGSDGTATEGTTTGGASQACADGCAVEFLCGTEWASEADCVAWCESNLVKAAGFSPFCADAWEAVSACVATLTCEEFSQWAAPMVFPYPCSDADVVLSVECKGQ